jgi:F-type H+-transporting ATPase subunit b
MPQIDQIGTIYASQLVWLLIVFAAIYIVIGKGMLPKIEGTIHARSEKIAGDLAAAEKARDEAEAVDLAYHAEMDQAHQGANDTVQTAKDGATRDADARLKAAQAAVNAKLHDAEQALAAARVKALAEVETVATEITRDIVERLSGAKVTDDEALGAVRAGLAA